MLVPFKGLTCLQAFWKIWIVPNGVETSDKVEQILSGYEPPTKWNNS